MTWEHTHNSYFLHSKQKLITIPIKSTSKMFMFPKLPYNHPCYKYLSCWVIVNCSMIGLHKPNIVRMFCAICFKTDTAGQNSMLRLSYLHTGYRFVGNEKQNLCFLGIRFCRYRLPFSDAGNVTQGSAVITRSDLSWYYARRWDNSDRK